MSTEETNYVYLKCVKEGGKLRVKVTTDGYFKDANTQFPKDIRQEGRRYKVRMSDIALIQTRGKYFYSVTRKSHIVIVDETVPVDLSKVKVHTDEDLNECVICMDAEKDIVFMPCGHLYTCETCSSKVTKCPMCRQVITNRIKRSLFG